MKFFNAIQIITALTTSPIWLSALKAATFTGAGALFWIGMIVTLIFFVWAILGVVETMNR
jgi:hypothetical protein